MQVTVDRSEFLRQLEKVRIACSTTRNEADAIRASVELVAIADTLIIKAEGDSMAATASMEAFSKRDGDAFVRADELSKMVSLCGSEDRIKIITDNSSMDIIAGDTELSLPCIENGDFSFEVVELPKAEHMILSTDGETFADLIKTGSASVGASGGKPVYENIHLRVKDSCARVVSFNTSTASSRLVDVQSNRDYESLVQHRLLARLLPAMKDADTLNMYESEHGRAPVHVIGIHSEDSLPVVFSLAIAEESSDAFPADKIFSRMEQSEDSAKTLSVDRREFLALMKDASSVFSMCKTETTPPVKIRPGAGQVCVSVDGRAKFSRVIDARWGGSDDMSFLIKWHKFGTVFNIFSSENLYISFVYSEVDGRRVFKTVLIKDAKNDQMSLVPLVKE